MVHTLTVSNCEESILNTEGRFRTLEGLYVMRNDRGEPLLTTNNHSVDIEIMYDGAPHLMHCFLKHDMSVADRLRQVAEFSQHIGCLYIMKCHYLEKEMLIFDSAGRQIWIDVMIQRLPQGERLDTILKPSEAIGTQLNELVDWLATNHFSHGNICPRNIYILPDGTPVLVNYTRASRQRSDADTRALTRLAASCSADVVELCDEEVTYKFIGEVHDGLARAEAHDGWIYLDGKSRQAFPGHFISADNFSEGRAVVETKDGFGLIDVEGRWIIDPEYDDIEWDSMHNVAIVTRDGLSGLYGRAGEPLTEVVYEQILAGNESMFPMRRDGRYGFLRRDGSVAIEPTFDDAFAFRNGFAKVELDKVRMTIDADGDIIKVTR